MGWVPIVGNVLSAGADIQGGLSQNASDQSAAKQYQQNAKNAMTAADQADAQRRGDLLSTLSSINAVRGSRGLDATSPTGMTIAQNDTTRAQMGIATTRLNYAQQAASDQVQAGIMQNQGTSALIGGFLKGGSSLFSAGSDAFNYFK